MFRSLVGVSLVVGSLVGAAALVGATACSSGSGAGGGSSGGSSGSSGSSSGSNGGSHSTCCITQGSAGQICGCFKSGDCSQDAPGANATSVSNCPSTPDLEGCCLSAGPENEQCYYGDGGDTATYQMICTAPSGDNGVWQTSP